MEVIDSFKRLTDSLLKSIRVVAAADGVRQRPKNNCKNSALAPPHLAHITNAEREKRIGARSTAISFVKVGVVFCLELPIIR